MSALAVQLPAHSKPFQGPQLVVGSPTPLTRLPTRRILRAGARVSGADQHGDDQATDEGLVAAVAQGSELAFDILYGRYIRSVVAVANRVVQEPEVADEVAQEVFLHLWCQAGRYNAQRGRLATWLLSITYHQAIDELRRRKSRPQIVASRTAEYLPDVVDTQVNIEHQVWLKVQRDLILRAIRELPASQQHVIELAYFEELTHRQIAARLDLPLGTVKTRLKLAMARLKRLLSASIGESVVRI